MLRENLLCFDTHVLTGFVGTFGYNVNNFVIVHLPSRKKGNRLKKFRSHTETKSILAPLVLSSVLMLSVILSQFVANNKVFADELRQLWAGPQVYRASPINVPSVSQVTTNTILSPLHTAQNSVKSAAAMPALVPLRDEPMPNGPPALEIQTSHGLYRAVHYLSKWDSAIHGWLPVSPNLTEVNQRGTPGYGIDGITAVSHLHHYWYVGTLTGRVEVKGTNGNWALRTHGLPPRTVSSIAIDPNDPFAKLAVVGFAGYSANTPQTPGHVFVTLDGGMTWLNLSGDLPDAPVTNIRFLPPTQDAQAGSWLQVQVGEKWYGMAGQGHWQLLHSRS